MFLVCQLAVSEAGHRGGHRAGPLLAVGRQRGRGGGGPALEHPVQPGRGGRLQSPVAQQDAAHAEVSIESNRIDPHACTCDVSGGIWCTDLVAFAYHAQFIDVCP